MPINKQTDEYNYQLNDTWSYCVQLGHTKWISMIDLKASYHNILFEHKLSYDSKFAICHRKYRWLRMLMGLTQAPTHFQFVVELVLKGKPGNRALPVVVYLDNIAVLGNGKTQVSEDTLEAIWRLTKAGFMINLKKSHLVEDLAKVLGHYWLTGGFWVPNVDKIQVLVSKTNKELGRMSYPLLYGFLNFYREHIPAFPKLVKPL